MKKMPNIRKFKKQTIKLVKFMENRWNIKFIHNAFRVGFLNLSFVLEKEGVKYDNLDELVNND